MVASAEATCSLAGAQGVASLAMPPGLPQAPATRTSVDVELEVIERPAEATPVRHRWRAAWTRLVDPRREQAAREALRVVHAAHVSEPAQLSASEVRVDRVEAQPPLELRRREVVLPRVLARDAAHGTHAARVEDPQF